MDVDFSNLNTEDHIRFARVFKEHGYTAMIVGGAVRDVFLGSTVKDIDWATDAKPSDVITMFERKGFNVIQTGIQHGTVTVMMHGEPYEVTTLRVDTNTDGRHADVEFTSDWKLDASRRDFTINALYYDPLSGDVFDFFDGIDDINNRIIRFVGDPEERIREDYLRILRYFRFVLKMLDSDPDRVSSLGLDTMPEDRIVKAIKDNINGLIDISRERIWMEFSRILVSRSFPAIVYTLAQTGINEVVLGHPVNSLPVNLFKSIRNFTVEPVALLVAYDISRIDMLNGEKEKQYIDKMVHLMKMSNREKKLFTFLVEKNSLAKSINFDIMDYKDFLVEGFPLDWVYILAAFGSDRNIMSELLHWEVPVFPITGKLLIELGATPGKPMGELLSRMKRKWMKSNYTLTADEMLHSEGLKNLGG